MATEKKTAKNRVRLNRDFVKLGKKFNTFTGIYEGHFEKEMPDVDQETGEIKLDAEGKEVRKMLRVLKFLALPSKAPVKMFETGGLKMLRDVIEEHGPKGIEIVWLDKEEISGGRNVNRYEIYPAEVAVNA